MTTIKSTPVEVSAEVVSPATKKGGKKAESHRRGRSVTVRNPEDSTNAACNIHSDEKPNPKMQRKREHHQSPQTKQLGNQRSDHLKVVAVTAFADRLALFGDTTLALVVSSALLVLALVISFLLEDLVDGETGK